MKYLCSPVYTYIMNDVAVNVNYFLNLQSKFRFWS